MNKDENRMQVYRTCHCVYQYRDVPSAEVEPFIVAHWVLILRRDKKPMIQCSNCKMMFKYRKDATIWRCPQCGAHMGGDE